MAKTKDAEIRRVCSILESVAKSFPRGSAQSKAVREAAEAYIFLQTHRSLKAAYGRFREMCQTELTAAQKWTLREMGISV
jgi:hypothetical protein